MISWRNKKNINLDSPLMIHFSHSSANMVFVSFADPEL